MLTQTFIVCYQDYHDTSTTLTIANQSEIPDNYYRSTVSFSSFETQIKFFILLITMSNVKYIILGKPSVSEKPSKNSLQVFTMSFKHSSSDQPKLVFFTAPVEINFLSFLLFIS